MQIICYIPVPVCYLLHVGSQSWPPVTDPGDTAGCLHAGSQTSVHKQQPDCSQPAADSPEIDKTIIFDASKMQHISAHNFLSWSYILLKLNRIQTMSHE